tara:strand:- start:855 stop:2021 length:1167 start_codon:yes stop_codon:yes gene_type:complete
MGIFDFFKRKKIEPELEETINFIEINDWIEKKKQSLKKEQEEPQEEIEQLLSDALKDLEEGINILNNLDLKDKKAPERAKLIVKQNLYNFINYLEKLIQELKKLTDESFETLISKTNSVFEDFEKKSIMSFQKSTFLIGEELGKIRDIIGKFFSSFNKIIKENQLSLNKTKTISIIGKKLKQIDNIEKTISENKTEISEINVRIDSLKQQIQVSNQEIEKIKQTQEYLEQINQNKELKELDTKLVIEYQSLKEILDFKVLAKIYHSIEDKMDLIKQYKENFKETFEKYSEEKFLDLVNIKQINQERVEEKTDSINTIKEKIKHINNNLNQDPSQESETEIQNLNRKIRELSPEITKKEKSIQKFKQNKEQIKQEIIEKLSEIKIIVED